MLKVKGDGRTYQFRVKTDEQYDGIAYRTLFATNAHQWQTLTLPFDSFTTGLNFEIKTTKINRNRFIE